MNDSLLFDIPKNFVAIDFETANASMSSVCSVGIVVVRDSKVEYTFYSCIFPVPNVYDYGNTLVHGLSYADTCNSPSFPEVWTRISSKIGDLPLVAHNAKFDEGCLKAVFKAYGMSYPNYKFIDTLKASRKRFGNRLPNHKLDTVAAACGFNMKNHHHALADAEACAKIALEIL